MFVNGAQKYMMSSDEPGQDSPNTALLRAHRYCRLWKLLRVPDLSGKGNLACMGGVETKGNGDFQVINRKGRRQLRMEVLFNLRNGQLCN